MTIRTAIGGLAMAGLLATAPVAFACGVCLEDKVAAAYDHTVVSGALQRGRVVVFCELQGPAATAVEHREARRALRKLRGVESGSVRTGRELPVVSFVLDSAVQSPERALETLRQRLQGPGIAPKLLKVISAPAG